MKIALAQIDTIIGDFDYNLNNIISNCKKAIQQKADLIIFPELAICGYPPQDLLNYPYFINAVNQSIQTLLTISQEIGILIGAPTINTDIRGKDFYNSALLLYNGSVQGTTHKSLLPTYDVFDEYRYFEPADSTTCIEFKGVKLAITICEDIWNDKFNPMYDFSPLDKLILEKPDVIINLSASPFHYKQHVQRLDILHYNIQKYHCPILYVNTVGAHTDLIFDGGSIAMTQTGHVLKQLQHFSPDLQYVNLQELYDLNHRQTVFTSVEPHPLFDANRNIEQIHEALILGINDYFRKSGFTKAIIASSGGIDSALTIALASQALGSENVHTLLLPSQYSSSHSVDDAIELALNLQCTYDIIAIESSYNTIYDSLQPIFKDLPINVTEENIQSRIRGVYVMALSNKFGSVLLNTSNKSELATGYGTLYGDMAGGLGILGDLYKEQVYALARYINRNNQIIPQNIIDKAPSAELRPDQKDSDSLPPYPVLDVILHAYIDNELNTEDIVKLGYDETLVTRVIKMVNKNEFKRHQFCPILRVSKKAFGRGRRIPIVAKYHI